MNAIAMIAILLATPLVQSDPGGQDCKAALNGLAVSAHAAVLATETADNLVVKVGDLETKLDTCRKGRGRDASGCAKIEASLKAAEADLDAAEEQLTYALEAVDAAYDEFDVACSWDDPDTQVQVRHLKPQRETRKPYVQTAASAPAHRAARSR